MHESPNGQRQKDTVSTGKAIRLRRLIDPISVSCRIVALDHGMTSPVFLRGLTDMHGIIAKAIRGGANVLMLGRGNAQRHSDAFAGRASLALMLTASAAGRPSGPQVTPIGSVEEALRLGADAVVVYVALGGENEPEMISYLSSVGEACDQLGVPLIAEAEYPDAYSGNTSTNDVTYLTRNARLCAELGADIVKVNWSGDEASFAHIIAACGRPVVVAGGSIVPDQELISRMKQAHRAGAIGFSVGRNIFEHPDPEGMTRVLSGIFHSPDSIAQPSSDSPVTQADDSGTQHDVAVPAV